MTKTSLKYENLVPVSIIPDELVPDPQAAREVGKSMMSLWRMTHLRPELGFPPVIRVGRRNFRSRQALEAFKLRLKNGELAEERRLPDRQSKRPKTSKRARDQR